MDKLFANLHWIIIIYAIYAQYDVYSTFEEEHTALKDQKSSIEAQLTQNEGRLKKIEKYRKDLAVYKKEMLAVQEQIEILRKRLPSEINDGFMMQGIREKASNLNLINPVVRSGEDVLNGFSIKKDYTLKGRGTFLQFLVFLENLDKFDQILNVNSLEFVAGDRVKQRGRFFLLDGMIQLEVYRYNASYVEEIPEPVVPVGRKK